MLVPEVCAFLGVYKTLIGSLLQIFWDNLSVLSSGVKESKKNAFNTSMQLYREWSELWLVLKECYYSILSFLPFSFSHTFFLFLYCLFSFSITCSPFLRLAAASCSGAVVLQSTPRQLTSFLPATSFMIHLLYWLASCSLRTRHWPHCSLYNCVPKFIMFISVH